MEEESVENNTENVHFRFVCCRGGVSCLSLYFFMPEKIRAINPRKTTRDNSAPPSRTPPNIRLPIIPATASPNINIKMTPRQLPIPFRLFIISSQWSVMIPPIIMPANGSPTSKNITYRNFMRLVFSSYISDESIIPGT